MSDKRTHKDHGLAEDVLRKLYEELLLSDAEIAGRFGLTDVAVGYYRRKYGIVTIKARDRIAAKARRSGRQDINAVSKGELEKLYQGLGERRLAKRFGCSRMLVRTRLKEFGIVAMSKGQHIRADLPNSLTQGQHEIVVGSLLGDANVHISKAGDVARFKEGHSCNQELYLRWKRDILRPFSKRVRATEKVLGDDRVCHGRCFVTCFHSVFVPYYEMFYSEGGKKRFPEGMIDNVTPLSLAVWYMDDGHLSDCSLDGRFTLCINAFRDDAELIADGLNRRFTFDTRVQWRSDGGVILWLDNKQKVFDVIGEHLHESMQYKVPVSLRFCLPFNACVDLVPVYRSIGRYGASDADDSCLVAKITKMWQIRGFPYPKMKKKDRAVEVARLRGTDVILDEPIDSGYNAGSSVCACFFPSLWRAHRNGGKSPLNVFGNVGLLEKAVVRTLKYRDSVSSSALRNEMRSSFGGVYNFRPAIAKAIWDRYCPSGGSVLDPCAGFGGRLLGFYVSQAGSYTGVDACGETVKGLKHMRCILSRDIPGKTVDIRYGAFEDVDIGDEQYDVVFTSPPYYTKEWYGDDDCISHNRYSTYDEWRVKFLERLITKSAGLLVSGGYLVLNIADVTIGDRKYLLLDDAQVVLRQVARYVDTHSMRYKSVFDGAVRLEPILVYQKP